MSSGDDRRMNQVTGHSRTSPEVPDRGEDAQATVAPDDDGAEARAPRRALPGRLVWVVWAAVAVAILVCDQATKAIAVAELSDRVIDLGFMDLRLVRNPKAAFGIPGFSGMFPIVALVVVALIVRALPDTDRLSLAAGYGLLTGGALGNAIDRVARYPGPPNGHVIDFFDLRWFPVFNIADSAIVCGAIALGLLLMYAEREERRLAEAPRRPSVRPDTSTPRR